MRLFPEVIKCVPGSSECLVLMPWRCTVSRHSGAIAGMVAGLGCPDQRAAPTRSISTRAPSRWPGSPRPSSGLLTSWRHPQPRGAAAAPARAARTSRRAQFHASLGYPFTAHSPPLRQAAARWRRVEKGKVARRHRREAWSQRVHPSAHPGAPPA